MGKKRVTLLGQELQAVDLEGMVLSAMADNGLQTEAVTLMAGGVPCLVVLGIGPVAAVLQTLAERLDVELNKPDDGSPAGA